MTSKKENEMNRLYKNVINSSEKGMSKADFWTALGDTDYNPDNITIKTYNKMLKDAQVYSARQVRVLGALSKGFDIKYPGKNQSLGMEMKEYLRKAFVNVNRSIFNNGGMYFIVKQLLFNGGSFGYSVGETVYGEYNELGDGYVYPKKIKILPQETLINCFSIDDYGNLKKVIQNANCQNEVIFESNSDLFRLMIYTHNMEFSNWYGRSDLNVNYKNWFIKDYLLKFWNIMLERYGAPFLLGKVSNPTHIADMNRALDSARTKTNFSIWKNDEVEIIESASAQREAFLNAIKYHDQQIMIGQVVPTLLMGIEETGARNLGEVHFRVFLWNIRNDQKEISDVLNVQIRKWIDMNFNNVDVYPEISFPFIANEDMTALSDAIYKLVMGKVISPDERWIRDAMNIPSDETLENTGGLFRSKDKNSSIVIKKSVGSRSEYTLNMNLQEIENILNEHEESLMKMFKSYLEKQKNMVLKNPNSVKRSREMRKSLNDLDDEYSDKLTEENESFGNKSISFESDLLAGIGLAMDTTFSHDALNNHIAELTRQTFKGSVNELAFSAKEQVLEALKQGKNPKEINDMIEKVYASYTSSKLQTVVRTITTDVYNSARLELFKANKDFVVGVRYDAILDDRTTPFCELHNGMTISMDNPEIDYIRPPNHFNCRSLYTPITVLDGSFEETFEIGDTYPDKDFGKEHFEEEG